MTINGSALVSEDTSHFDPWFTARATAGSFEGASPQADGWWDAGLQGGTYSTAVKLYGAHSAKFNIIGTGALNEDGDEIAGIGQNLGTFYFRTYLRLHRNSTTGWPVAKFKMIYLQAPGQGWILAPTFGAEWPSQLMVFYDGAVHYANIPSGKLQPDRWYCLEYYVHTAAPRSWVVWVDGTQVYSGAPSGGPAAAWDYLMLGFEATDGTAGMNLDSYYDGVGLGSSRLYPLAKVEIGNSSNYSTATKVVQPMTSISDTSLGITCDLTGLGTGPYYIFVTNNRQQVSAAFQLGSGDIPRPPSAPVIR